MRSPTYTLQRTRRAVAPWLALLAAVIYTWEPLWPALIAAYGWLIWTSWRDPIEVLDHHELRAVITALDAKIRTREE